MEKTLQHEQKTKFVNIVSDFSLEQLSNIIKNAKALEQLGQYEEAISWYDLAIEKNPIDPNPWYDKGNVFDSIGKYEEAISCYDKVLEINTNDTSAMYNKATVLSRIGKYEESNYCYDKLISIDPTHTGALYNKRVTLNKLGMHYGVMPMKQKQIL